MYDKTYKKYKPEKAPNKSVEYLELGIQGAPRNQHKQLKQKVTKSAKQCISITPKSVAKSWKGANANEYNTSTGVSIDAFYENIGAQHKWSIQVKKQELRRSEMNVWLQEHQRKKSKSIYKEYIPKAGALLHFNGRTNDAEFQEWVQNDILALNTSDGKSYYHKLTKDEYAAIHAAQIHGQDSEWYYNIGEFLKEYYTILLPLQFMLNKHLWSNIDKSDGPPKDIYKDGRGIMFVNMQQLPSQMEVRGGGLTQIKGEKYIGGIPRPMLYGYYNSSPEEQQEFLEDGLNIPTDGRYCYTPEYLELYNDKYGKDLLQEAFYGGKTLFESFEDMYKHIFYHNSDKPRIPGQFQNGVRSVLVWSKFMLIHVILANWDITGSEKLIDQLAHIQGLKILRNLHSEPIFKYLAHYRKINYNETGLAEYDRFRYIVEDEKYDENDDENDNNNNNNSNRVLFNVETYKKEITIDHFDDETNIYTGITKRKDSIESTPIRDFMTRQQQNHWNIKMKRDYKDGLQFRQNLYDKYLKEHGNKKDKKKQTKKDKREIDASSTDSNGSDNDTVGDLTFTESKNKDERVPMRSISQINALNDGAEMFEDDDPFGTPQAKEPSHFASASLSATPTDVKKDKWLNRWRSGDAVRGYLVSNYYWNLAEVTRLLKEQETTRFTLWNELDLASDIRDQCFYNGDEVKFGDNNTQVYRVIMQKNGHFNKETMQTNGGILECVPVDDNNNAQFDQIMEFDLSSEPVTAIVFRPTLGKMTSCLRIGHVLQVGAKQFILNMVEHEKENEMVTGWETLVKYNSDIGNLYFSMSVTPSSAQFMRIIGKIPHKPLVLRTNPWFNYDNILVGHHFLARNDTIIYGN